MTITEYYNNYLTTKQFPNRLLNGHDSTIDDFYNSCIVKNLCPTSNVLAWHKMFMKYVDMNDAILWVRYHEGCPMVNGRYPNRRACYTEFADGFSYVFVSNYDVHEIYNMVFQGVTPDVNEFKNLMKTFKNPLHYDNGSKNLCEESDICAYPHIGKVKGGVLSDQCWYLAHIYGIKDAYLRPDGKMKTIDKKERDGIFPRGSLNDWQKDSDGIMKRKLNYSLSADEKALVKAHFLRFVDPLNYFIVPGESYENHDIYSGKRIGEYKDLTEYVGYKFEHVYGTKLVKDFRDKALICMPISVNIPSIKAQNINIIYGRKLKTNSKSTSSSTKTKTTTITLKNKKKNMLIEQSKNKNDLRDRLMAYVTKPKAFVTPLKKVSRRAHKFLLDNNCPPSSARQYYNWLDPTIHSELNNLLKKHGIKGSIYTCTNLKQIAEMFDELVDNTSKEAQKANRHQNMVSAVRHFIEHLLSVNGITI